MVLGSIFFGLAGLTGLIITVLYIILLVKVFKHGGVGLGILGLFCGPFTYIWGWMKSKELGLKKLMIWMTLLIIVSGIFYGIGAAAFFSDPEVQKNMNIQINGKTYNGGVEQPTTPPVETPAPETPAPETPKQ